MVALIITIINPAAAQEIHHGCMRVMPGRVSPIAANTSATPRKMRNAGGMTLICSNTDAGGEGNTPALAKKATARGDLSTPKNEVLNFFIFKPCVAGGKSCRLSAEQ